MADIVLVKPHQRSANTAQTPGMVRQAGIAPDVCGSKGLWFGFVSVPPGNRSGIHHHGDAETGIYVLRGRLRFSFGDKLEKSVIAEPGDFLYVPPQTMHMEENLDDSQPRDVIVARNATEFNVVNVPDPREGS